MRSKLPGFLLFTAVLAVSLLYQAKIARATPASGFAATTLAKGQLAQFEVFNHFVLPSTNSGDDDHSDGNPIFFTNSA